MIIMRCVRAEFYYGLRLVVNKSKTLKHLNYLQRTLKQNNSQNEQAMFWSLQNNKNT